MKGLGRAVDEPEKAPAGGRLLIVLSDGTDVNRAEAVKQLPGLKQRIAAAGIDLTSIVYKTSCRTTETCWRS